MTEPEGNFDRAIDLAFNVPIAGAAFARDLTKFAVNQMAGVARDVVAGVATAVADERSAAVQPRADHPDHLLNKSAATVVVAAEELEVDGAVAVDVEELAIDGYDELNARQIVALLADLNREELGIIEVYENAGRGRRTVLSAVAQQLAG